jgi:hypothetical protein
MRVNGYAMGELQETMRRAIRPEATPGDLAAFRSALLALDKEVTGGKLPALSVWQNGPPPIAPVPATGGIAVLVEYNSGIQVARWLQGQGEDAPIGATANDFPRGRVLAHLPLRVEDALPEGAERVRNRPLEPEVEAPTYRCTRPSCSWSGYNSGTWCPGCCQIRWPQLVTEGEVG